MDEQLIIVNKHNLYSDIPKNLCLTEKENIKDGKLNKEVYKNFLEMKKAARKFGYHFYVESGYRSYEEQVGLWISRMIKEILNYIKNYENEIDVDKIKNDIEKEYFEKYKDWYQSNNLEQCYKQIWKAVFKYLPESIKDKTAQLPIDFDRIKNIVELKVAHPGTSEHHCGLAFDIQALKFLGTLVPTQHFKKKFEIDLSESEKESKWLNDNCYKYGFILRYPDGKKVFTGVSHEQWHFRYVGSPEIAKEIMTNKLTLEEYLIAQNIISKFNNKEDLTPEEISNYIDDLIMSDSSNIFDDIVGTVTKKQIRDNKLLLDDLKNYLKGKLVKNNSNEIQKKNQDTQALIQRPTFEPHSYPTYGDDKDTKHI